jgi:hypothetical protein
MTELELQITDSFSRVYPVPAVTADWDSVLRGACRRRRRPRLAPMTVRRRLVLALALALVIAAALSVSTIFTSSPRVLDRAQAQAALDPKGRILHIVSRWVDDRVTLEESWALPDGSLWHVVSRYQGQRFGSDCVTSEDETRCWNPALSVVDVWRHRPSDPGLPADNSFRYGANWPQGASRALSAGYARLLGDTSFCGKDVYAVSLAIPGPAGPPQFGEASHTIYLDRETYLPVAEQMPESRTMRYFDTFEFLPDTAANREAIELPSASDARVVVHPVGVYPPEEKGPPPAGSVPEGSQCTPR